MYQTQITINCEETCTVKGKFFIAYVESSYGLGSRVVHKRASSAIRLAMQNYLYFLAKTIDKESHGVYSVSESDA